MPRDDRPTRFADVATLWLSLQVHRQASVEVFDTLLRNHVLPAFADRDVRTMRRSDVQAWVADRAKVLAPASVEVAYCALAGICTLAEADGLIGRSPCVDIRLPRIERTPVVPPSIDEVDALAEAVPDRYCAVVLLAAGTGLRQGECFGLSRDRIDDDAAHITVDRQLYTPTQGPPYVAPPKTRASYRRVPLPASVAEVLEEHQRRFPPHRDGFLFTNGRGALPRRNSFGEMWRNAVRRAGLTRMVHFHDLRHFYASLLIHHGESVKVVQARLGHASVTETLDTYAHLWPDNGDRTRAAINEVLSIPTAVDGGA